MEFVSINPATEAEDGRYPLIPLRDARRIASETARIQHEWRGAPLSDRAAALRRLAEVLERRTEELARLIAREMGKPHPQGEAEIGKCAAACRYYADHAPGILDDENAPTEAQKSYVHYEPLGVILAIMPWNFPFWQVFRFGAGALAAGNAILLKHAPNVTGCALTIEALFREAGWPPGLARALVIDHDTAGDLIDYDAVRAVTLTGSVRAGRAVAARAGAAIKKTVLELGGSDPYIILEDADLDHAAEACVNARLINSGQSCIAAKRFIAVEPVREAFTERFVELMRKKRYGPPAEPGIDMGPLARSDLRDALHRQVVASANAGAECVLGGSMPEGPGYYYPPSVYTGVAPGMPLFDEEVFGPVAAIVGAKDEEEAVALANHSIYGLGGAVFTKDLDRGERIVRDELRSGNGFVNDFVRSDPRLPFGGIRASGYGRELGGMGIREFVNAKTVYVA